MVEVFKTNVEKPKEAKILISKLAGHFPKHKINFDLEDCDKILRVEGKNISPEKIVELMNSNT
ncbi:MAG: hypothetical protein ABIT08_00745, partial [Bacteroidia bacterium]